MFFGGGSGRYTRRMNILLNGQPFEVPGEITLAELVRLRRIETPAYAVERNKEVVGRRELATTALKENDRIEIVVAVGGG
jgi:sulfur carrier protein